MREMTIEQLHTSDDWYSAIREASLNVAGVVGYTGSTDPFDVEDVVEILALANGEGEGPNWIGAFRLADGRYAWVQASCSVTGWDVGTGYARVADSWQGLVQWAIGKNERARLGLV